MEEYIVKKSMGDPFIKRINMLIDRKVKPVEDNIAELKEQIDSSSSGGKLYKHYVDISHVMEYEQFEDFAEFYMQSTFYSTSSTQLAAQNLFKQLATSVASMSGYMESSDVDGNIFCTRKDTNYDSNGDVLSFDFHMVAYNYENIWTIRDLQSLNLYSIKSYIITEV